MAGVDDYGSERGVKVVPTGACHDCGGRCVFNVHVKDGIAIRMETDEGEEPQLRACLRGRAYRMQVYSSDRLLYPLKRVGARGEDKFERISWDEALDTVAREFLRVKETYGTQAIMLYSLSGIIGFFHNHFATDPIIGGFGRFSKSWGGMSAEGSVFANRATYGTLTTGNTRDDLVNSRLILLWGLNPCESIFGTNTSHYLIQAKETGTRVVVIDPRYTDTAATLADQWIPIRPSTDAAMIIAMAYVMITENLQDQVFLDKYAVGFDQFKDYVLGVKDGTAKTPAWAEAKTGVPAQIIVALAREYATIKPAAFIPGFAPGRTAYGEQFHRAASTLAAMTGNVGIHGGGAAGFERGSVGPMVPPNVSESRDTEDYEMQMKALDIPRRLRQYFHYTKVWDAVLKGKAGGYPADIKAAYIYAGNPLNQQPNLNKGIKALKQLEFIAVAEQFMTATARFADILLPVATNWERNDFSRPWLSGPYFLYQNQVVKPVGEVKTDREILTDLSKRLGVYNPSLDIPEEEGIHMIMASQGDVTNSIPDLEEFRKSGVHKIQHPGPQLAFKRQIDDPENNPFPTPSGKIEIFCQRLADLNNPEIPPIPQYMDPEEGPTDPLAKSYPLQMLSFHHKCRAHSIFHNNPWLKDIEPQGLWINTEDAESRGIKDGDEVRVFNDKGETIIQAKVTERIMPEVVALGEGAWYQPDESGRDRSGNPNLLTDDRYSPGGAFPGNTSLVQVERFVS